MGASERCSIPWNSKMYLYQLHKSLASMSKIKLAESWGISKPSKIPVATSIKPHQQILSVHKIWREGGRGEGVAELGYIRTQQRPFCPSCLSCVFFVTIRKSQLLLLNTIKYYLTAAIYHRFHFLWYVSKASLLCAISCSISETRLIQFKNISNSGFIFCFYRGILRVNQSIWYD